MAKVRHVHGGTAEFTEIITCDKMDPKCHAFHQYEIYLPSRVKDGITDPVAQIHFQTGPIREAGVNGCSNEDLLAIVADRLECLQKGKFPCEENRGALRHVLLALGFLHQRTADRKKRGVEGKNKA